MIPGGQCLLLKCNANNGASVTIIDVAKSIALPFHSTTTKRAGLYVWFLGHIFAPSTLNPQTGQTQTVKTIVDLAWPVLCVTAYSASFSYHRNTDLQFPHCPSYLGISGKELRSIISIAIVISPFNLDHSRKAHAHSLAVLTLGYHAPIFEYGSRTAMFYSVGWNRYS